MVRLGRKRGCDLNLVLLRIIIIVIIITIYIIAIICFFLLYFKLAFEELFLALLKVRDCFLIFDNVWPFLKEQTSIGFLSKSK